ncbi:MAG: hypothetical protein J6Z27_04215, partial [Bacteroidales bacterium]|nr:hypothetical protein [Bacteroidales bacterium]
LFRERSAFDRPVGGSSRIVDGKENFEVIDIAVGRGIRVWRLIRRGFNRLGKGADDSRQIGSLGLDAMKYFKKGNKSN